MRTIHLMLIAVALLSFAVAGCTGSNDRMPSTSAATQTMTQAMTPAAAPATLNCGKNERICTSCDGLHQFCAEFCPHCIPPVTDEVSTTPHELACTSAQSSAVRDGAVM